MSTAKQLGASKHNGLTAWREQQAEDKRLRLLELEHYRAYATEEERDGRTYTVVRIPDRYEEPWPELKPAVQLRRTRKRT